MVFPEPVISLAIEPKTKADQEKLGMGMQKLMAEDPTFRVSTDEQTGQVVIAGMGELHLEIIVDRLKREFGVEASVGKPQVAYKETLTKPAEGHGLFKRQTGGRGQFGDAWIRLFPLPPGEGYQFENDDGRRLDSARVHQADRPGHPGSAHARHPRRLPDRRRRASRCSTVRTTTSTRRKWPSRLPVRWRSRTPPRRPAPVLMEPVMRVEVVCPKDNLGDVMGDLASRRGRIQSQEDRGGTQIISARVPLSDMFGYATDLRSRTQGRATYSMFFDRYEQAPRNVSEEVIARVQGTK